MQKKNGLNEVRNIRERDRDEKIRQHLLANIFIVDNPFLGCLVFLMRFILSV